MTQPFPLYHEVQLKDEKGDKRTEGWKRGVGEGEKEGEAEMKKEEEGEGVGGNEWGKRRREEEEGFCTFWALITSFVHPDRVEGEAHII